MPVLFTFGALSNPVLFDTVVQHWLLAVDRDRIAVGLSFEFPPVCIVKCFMESWPTTMIIINLYAYQCHHLVSFLKG